LQKLSDTLSSESVPKVNKQMTLADDCCLIYALLCTYSSLQHVVFGRLTSQVASFFGRLTSQKAS
jgi:hypothetical protein